MKNTKEIVLPEDLRERIAGESYQLDEIGKSGSTVMLLRDKVLKIRPVTPQTRAEVAILNWANGKVPVPECLYHAEVDGTDYLLMTKVDGRMSCEKEWMQDPEWLVQQLADSMKRLWSVKIEDCPVQNTLDKALEDARYQVEYGLVDVEDTNPETFGAGGFRDPEHLLEWLCKNRPEEDLVLSHGDFCLPNVFLNCNGLTGFIDLDRMGVADRWQDIALCYRSLNDNYNGIYSDKDWEAGKNLKFSAESLFDVLGVAPDREKLRYYILLDELF